MDCSSSLLHKLRGRVHSINQGKRRGLALECSRKEGHRGCEDKAEWGVVREGALM